MLNVVGCCFCRVWFSESKAGGFFLNEETVWKITVSISD